MRRHVLSKLDDLDLDARDLAIAAARRAGLSLEDWAATVLAEQDERHGTSLRRRSRLAGSEVESIIAGTSKTARRQPSSDYEALMAAAAAESERQVRDRLARDQEARTAIALESIASWIEQAEERLNETARTSADHQDRMASVLSQALSALKERLDTVERHVVSDRPAPARIEFPVQDAIKALAPLSETLTGLRTDMSRLAERLEQPTQAWTPAVEGIRTEIEHLRSSMGSLATRKEIAALDHAVRDTAQAIAKDLEQGRSSKDLLTLANSIAALYQQVQSLSGDMAEDMHRRLGSEIDLIKGKIDRVAETGVDRSVIDFLSSQIVDMRQDLAHRAEPQQIERLSGDIASLSRQVADLGANQVGRGDIASLKGSLENVCSALNRTVAAQEESAVPEQLQSLGQRLDLLLSRPEPEPANLNPIAEQLELLTERMTSLSNSRLEQTEPLAEMIGRLSSQVQAVADKEAPSQQPLMERFDRLEQELRQVGHLADTSTVELMLRSIGEKLERAPAQMPALDTLEQQITVLADRLAQTPGEPLRRILDEATGHLKNLQSETAGIAERAAKAALKDIRPNLPDAGDLDALKQGFVELKALQTRADKKTQQSLHAVHNALETLASRFPGQSLAPQAAAPAVQAPSDRPSPADRLEAAVRRLHTAALSQIEDVSTAPAQAAPPTLPQTREKASPKPEFSQADAGSFSPPETDLGNMRASFIAAARRASQVAAPDNAAPEPFSSFEPEIKWREEAGEAMPDASSASPLSLIERIRRTFESHRRPLLFGLAFLILAAGTTQILSSGPNSSSVASAHASETPQGAQVEAKPLSHDPTAGVLGASVFAGVPSVFQTSSLTSAPPSPISLARGKFLIDPKTVGEIPAGVPEDLQQAALSGDATAIYEIASRAMEGRDLAQDMALAVRLYERAAQAGLPPAQERLAMLHEKGVGVPRDAKLAAAWYGRAAQGGNIRAMHNLATLLASGVNGKPDYATALRWYGEAAEAGLRDSQFNMGVLLGRGIGTKQDLANAFKWFALAAMQGDTDAAKKCDEIAARLGAAELATAKAAVEQWRPRAVDPVANDIAPPAKRQAAVLDRTSSSRS